MKKSRFAEMFIITFRLLRLLIDKNYRYAPWTCNKADNSDFNKRKDEDSLRWKLNFRV